MTRSVVNPGTLYWSGEHWINYLRVRGSDKNSAMVSLYHTRYSAAGEGNVAFIEITAPTPFVGICSDNVEVAQFIQSMIRGRNNPFDREMTTAEAAIYRLGDIRSDPGWVIETEAHRIEATWQALKRPIVAEGPAPTFGPDRDFFTVLFFAQQATITIDGQPCQGEPYERDIWAPTIGGLRSSCVFALAETMTLLPI